MENFDKKIVADKRVKKYDYGQMREALIGYLANLDLRINDIVDKGLPVYSQGIDAGYFMSKKFNSDEKDFYNTIPRVVVKFEDLIDNKDLNGSQDVKIRYIFNEKSYEGFFRRKTKVMTVVNHFVSNNYIRALEYYEIIESLMRKTTPYTYEFLGNTYQGAYELISSIIQNPSMDMGSTSKDFIVVFTCELQIHIMSPNYSSLKEIDVFKGVNEGDGFGGSNNKTEKNNNKTKWQINSATTDNKGNTIDSISELETPHNPNCIGCKTCNLNDLINNK